VRDFAASKNLNHPGDDSASRAREFAARKAGVDAEAGMEEMAKKYRDGGDLYVTTS
jgi:hypothetical protein